MPNRLSSLDEVIAGKKSRTTDDRFFSTSPLPMSRPLFTATATTPGRFNGRSQRCNGLFAAFAGSGSPDRAKAH